MNGVRLMVISDEQESCFSQPSFLLKYNKYSQIKQIFKGRQVTLLERQCCCFQKKVQVEETRAVSAWPTQEFTSSGSDHLLEISTSHAYGVQVVDSWRLVALKVPCTSYFPGRWGRVSERTCGQLESCPSSRWLGAYSLQLNESKVRLSCSSDFD